MEKLGIFIGLIIVLIIALIYSVFSWGLVICNFWEWFILPVFKGLPSITYLQAGGLMFFISLFKGCCSYLKDKFEDKTTKWSIFVAGPWLMLLFGYLFNTFFIK